MFKSAGFLSHQFASTRELLETDLDQNRGCVIADLNIVGDEPIKLPGLLEALHIELPVVFVSADDSDSNRAKVQSVGGFGLFRKPVDDQALIDAVRWAIDRQEARAKR
jgi:FixJ family two-component response regulator